MGSVSMTFHGAAGTVTGSCFEIAGANVRLLVDCGMFQGTRSLEALNFEPFPFDPGKIDAVILTHAHLDHSGRLPYLVRSGCEAPIWCTAPTADIIEPLLLDSAKLQGYDTERRNRRPDRARQSRFEPLYDSDDVVSCIGQLRQTNYCEWNDLGHGNGFRFWDARHIVGSASIELLIDGVRILLSGDIGNGRPIACGDSRIGGYDHVICEATYGDRNREPVLTSDRREQLARHIEDTLSHGGNLLIPAFAVERTQIVLEDICALFASKRLKPINVFVDSPLAERVTRATMRHRHGGFDLFDQPTIRFTHDVQESIRLNAVTGMVILAGSGMCEGGRIRHHLVHNLPRRNSRVLLVGYQVAGTLGSVLRDGAKHVRISGKDVPVNAGVHSLDSYSVHADRAGLLEWIAARGPVSGSVFAVHGETAALAGLADGIAAMNGFRKALVPALGETWQLAPGAAAKRVGRCRSDARKRVAPRDWTSRVADLKSGLDERLAALPNDAARERAVAALSRALASIEAGRTHSAQD